MSFRLFERLDKQSGVLYSEALIAAFTTLCASLKCLLIQHVPESMSPQRSILCRKNIDQIMQRLQLCLFAEQAPTCAAVDILSNALQLGCIVEVGRADGLPHQIPIRSCRLDIDFLLLHDFQQLLPDFLGLPQDCNDGNSRL